MIDPGPPFAIDIVPVPAGGDWRGEYEPREDGGRVILRFPRSVNGEIEVYRDGVQINASRTHAYGVGGSKKELVIERLAPDADYEFVLRGPYVKPTEPGGSPYQALLPLGSVRIVAFGEAVLDVPEERLIEDR